jgi:sugar-specific transcriptional regulator TrmB
MNDKIKPLNKLGLSDKQAIIYLTLLELGEAKITDVAKKSNLKRPTVYLVIEELALLGLVSMIVNGKKKIYSAVHPKRIGELLDFRKNQFQNILPDLINIYGSGNRQPKIQFFEGADGVRQLYREVLSLLPQRNSEQLWLSNIHSVSEKFPEIINEYTRILNKFPKSRIREILFGKKTNNDYLKKFKIKLNPNHKIKYIKNNTLDEQTDQLILENRIIFFSINPELFALSIESPEIAKIQRFMFENLWKSI